MSSFHHFTSLIKMCSSIFFSGFCVKDKSLRLASLAKFRFWINRKKDEKWPPKSPQSKLFKPLGKYSSLAFFCKQSKIKVLVVYYFLVQNTAQKMKFSIKDFFSKCDQIHSFLRIWSHLMNKSLMENFIFCAIKPFVWKNFCDRFIAQNALSQLDWESI